MFFGIILQTINLAAQSEFDLINQAKRAYCSGDTLQTIRHLESYTERYPENGKAVVVSLRLSDFYINSKAYQSAVSKLKQALDTHPKNGYFFFRDTCNLFSEIDLAALQAEICVKLSDVFIVLGDFEQGLNFLTLADTKYLPGYGGCANGMIMYRTKLSLNFAELYLKMGDTTKAIDRLLDYFMSNEYYDKAVTQKLKTILLTHYDQRTINREIEQGIKKMKFIKGAGKKEPEKILCLTLFGHTLRLPVYASLDDHKKMIRGNKNLQLLTKG